MYTLGRAEPQERSNRSDVFPERLRLNSRLSLDFTENPQVRPATMNAPSRPEVYTTRGAAKRGCSYFCGSCS